MTRRDHEAAIIMDEVAALLQSAIYAIDVYDTPAPSLVGCAVETDVDDACVRKLQLRDSRLFIVRVFPVKP